MENGDHDIESIEKYLNDELSADEKDAFNSRLSAEPELAQKLDGFRLAVEGIRNEALRLELDQIHYETLQQKPEGKNVWMYLGGIAAAVVMGLFLYLFNAAPSDEELFVAYFEPYPNILSTRTQTSESQANAFLESYSKGDYTMAAGILESMDNDQFNDDLRFYAGVTYLALGLSDKAGSYFVDLQESEYRQQVRWYLGLVYLKGNQQADAIEVLQRIRETEFKYKEARQLIDQLK